MPDVYIELAARARHLASLLRDACVGAGFPAQFPVVGTLRRHGLRRRPRARRLRRRQAHRRGGLRARSSRPCWPRAWRWRPGAYEAIFVGLGHDDAVLAEIGERASRAAVAAVEALAVGAR